MKPFILIVLLQLALFGTFADNNNTSVNFFQAADAFLAKNISDGRVDYKGIKQKPQELNNLLELIAKYDLEKQPANTQKAFWINAYNILVIKGIINHFPVKSPMDIKGFFDTEKRSAAGRQITLNDIENKMIRPVYNDARIHFVLVCAAIGCPQIVNFAYMPEKLDAQLEKQTRMAMNDPQFIRVNTAEKKLDVSEIFKWYKEDFAVDGNSIRDYVNQYRDQKVPADYAFGFYTYDWNLNIKKK